MSVFFTLLFLSSLVCISKQQECKNDVEIVCYWGSWAWYRTEIGQFTSDDLDTTICTKIIYTFAGLDEKLEISPLDHELDVTMKGYANVTNLKIKNPCLKIILAVGGWNEGSQKYSIAAYTAERRQKFADNVLKFLVYYDFDGIDVDWEYPTTRGGVPADGENFAALLRTVKDTISPWGFAVSTAVAIDETLIGTAYIIKDIADTVDYVHLMAYDYVPSTSNKTGLSSPMSAMNESVSLWLDGGLPAKKLILGLPAYARNFVLQDPSQTGIGAPVGEVGRPGPFTKEDGFLAYYEVLDTYKYVDYTIVSVDGTNYAYLDDEWLTYENVETVKLKTQYALDLNLGGIMLWSLDTDDFRGKYGNKYPLLNAINDAIQEHKVFRYKNVIASFRSNSRISK
ncbi:unnamed protein product [Phaedon cochleariae]|uniref:GH18 domain-containing protein n=1 Tax=Phaedon cochleariae TaxID=80249 RepID=A0A9N9SMW8_PHACE|nr:unnamed protein product [Phaedon cochleariae]